MEDIIIYHNNSCSKSRECLQIMIESDIEPSVVNYLMDEITEEQLTELIRKLALPASELIRKSEETYQRKYKGRKMSEKAWIKAMLKHRELIERPIVVKGDKAIIARPPDRVYELIKK